MSDDAFQNIVTAGGHDLVAQAVDGLLGPVWYRDADAAAILEHLDQRRSVLLVGPAGVGKTSIVHAVAEKMAERGRGRLAQLSTTAVMAGTKYLGEWETKIENILRAAAESNGVLYFTDVWGLPYAGKTSNSERNLLDAIRPWLLQKKVALLAELTPEALRMLDRTPMFVDLFVRHPVAPLPDEQVDDVIARTAERMQVPVDAPSRRTLVTLTSRFLPSRPQPGPALQLLQRVRDYQEEKLGIGEQAPVTPAFVERVFAIFSGLPAFVVSRTATKRAEEIREFFRDRIVGQQEAIEAVVETIALFKAGLCDPDKPIGTFLFVGPTGVGKTELARALATFLFGSPTRLLRFDLSELKDYHSFEQLIGSARDPLQPARLVDPVRSQPFQVVLLDEIEKAHSNVWDLLLPLLDEGRLTPPSGVPVDFRRTIVIATSNVGAEDAAKSVGFGAAADVASRRLKIRGKLEQHFRPELLNRFQHIVVFHPLTAEQVRAIARQELKRVLSREGVTGRNLVVEVDDQALDLVISRGYDARYGARALKRELQQQVVLPLAVRLMEDDVTAGQLLRIGVADGRLRIRVVDTEASREEREQHEPVKVAGRKLDRVGFEEASAALRGRVHQIAREVGRDRLAEDRLRLQARRDEPAFWQDAEAAAVTLRDLDRIGRVLDRLDRLEERLDAFDGELAKARAKREMENLGPRLTQLEEAVDAAWRELVLMGPEGAWDALVEVAPIGSPMARDLLVEVYLRWAKAHGHAVEWLREPMSEDEPAFFAVRGRFAHGLLKLESGLHRWKKGEETSVARVRVAPWDDRPPDRVELGEHRALKREGVYGGKVRSRLECGDLVLQNARTLAENRELALELVGPWSAAPSPSDEVVRRYDPPLVKDALAGASQRPDALSAERFQILLCARLEATRPG